MNFAGLTTEKQKLLWCEAATTATMLDNILVHEQNSAPPYTIFLGRMPNMPCFCEICVTADTFNKVQRIKLLQNMLQKDTFKARCCCFENVPNTAPTVVWTINVSIDCNWSQVPNPN